MQKDISTTHAQPLSHRDVSTEVAASREVAEVQGAIILARRFPRDEQRALDAIVTACARQGLAEQALYSYARGGTDITGPSIRLAEAIARKWQNITFGVRELEQRNNESTVEAFAWDMENNVRQSKQFQVPHVRYSRAGGAKKLSDPRDIYETVANQGARRMRACILGLIPGDIVEAAVNQCEMTLKQHGEVTPERLKGMVEKFDKLGVTKTMLEKRVQRRLDAITPAILLNLGKIHNSLRDGMSKPADWFEVDTKDIADRFTEPASKTGLTLKPKEDIKNAEEPQSEAEFDTIACPNAGKEISTSRCVDCVTREGCPAYD